MFCVHTWNLMMYCCYAGPIDNKLEQTLISPNPWTGPNLLWPCSGWDDRWLLWASASLCYFFLELVSCHTQTVKALVRLFNRNDMNWTLVQWTELPLWIELLLSIDLLLWIECIYILCFVIVINWGIELTKECKYCHELI